MSPGWKRVTKKAIIQIQQLNYNLPDLAIPSKLNEVIDVLKPTGKIKRVKSGNENFMPASKILNFIFPGLIPKIDTYWIKGVCLKKLNKHLSWRRFITSGPTDINQYKEYLQFASEQVYDDGVLTKLEHAIGIKDAYAVCFEYCLLGFSRDEILDLLNTGTKDEVMAEEKSNKFVSSSESKKASTNPYDVVYHRNWINSESLRLVFDKMREDMKSISDRLEENPVKSYLGYKYRGNLVSWILVYRNSIEIGTYNLNGAEVKKRVMNKSDYYSDIIKKTSEYFEYLDGK
jgi:hypothetical protein